METGFLNLHDDEHFSTQLYDQGTVDEMEASLRTFVADEFPALEDILDDSEGSLLNGDMAVLPLAVPLDGNIPKMDPRNKEDFQKMLTDWQEHIGSLQLYEIILFQASDSEDMDVKDIVGLDMVLPKPISDHLPDDIFEDEINPLVSPKKLTSPNKITPKFPAVLGISIKSELSLDNFMECEDDEEEPEKKVFEDGAVDTENNSTEDGAVNTMNNSTEDGAVDTMNKSTEETSTDVKIEVEEDCVDVETVSEQIPVLEAKDLTSLLEQFEASEAFNTSSNTKPKPSVLDTHLYAMATQQIPAMSITSTMSPKSCTSVLSHQSIKDSLPKEVIDRIKASGRKKVIPVIPAMPSRRIVRGGTRMQDAGAALSRNKLLKIVKLAPPPRSFYHSDASEYSLDKSSNFQENEDKVKSQEDEKIYSRLPDYYTVLAPQKVIEKNDSRSRKVNVRDEESWGENNSKKDSGLESGEVSDASEEIIASPSESVQQLGNRSVKKTINLKSSSKNSILSSSAKTCNNILSVNGKDYHIASTNINNSKIADNIQNINKKPAKEMTMVSVLKKCQVANVSKHIVSSSGANSDTVPVSEVVDTKEEKQGPKKRKLNIQEYRSRLKELDRIRGSRENSRANSPISSQTCTVSVGTSMMEDAASDMKNGSSNSGSVAENNITSEPVISVINQKDSLNRPEMQSVEVQTLPENEVPTVKETEKEKKEARNRERRRRQYRSRRATSSSSNGSSNSSSSSSSRNYRRRRTNSRSTQRRKRR
ncbi:hypothetical protein C0J52_19126 [Blattella germanica]|nr:hypothetical protein C0J52_19126 [Blattella germanica]